MTSRHFVVALCVLSAMPFVRANAQRRFGGDTLSKRATAESLSVLADLEKRVKGEPRNAQAWYRLGMVASSLSEQGRERYYPRGVTRNVLDATAARSLRTAASLDSTNAHYWYSLSKYYRTGTDDERVKIPDIIDRVVQLSRVAHDTALLLTSLMEKAGRRYAEWYSRDNSVDESPSLLPPRANEPGTVADPRAFSFSLADPTLRSLPAWAVATGWNPPGSVAYAAGRDSLKFIGDLIRIVKDRVEQKIGRTVRSGPLEYARHLAEEPLAEAFALSRTDYRAYPYLATLYTAASDWGKLGAVAREQVRRSPQDTWAWMALGLAEERSGKGAQATASFANALARMTAAERQHYDRIERILTWYDSTQYVARDPATRAKMTARMWLFADPLWSTDDGNPQQEFLARIAYAELRWPRPYRPFDDDSAVKGVDTGRGDLYLRYGPPNAVRAGFWIYDAGLIFSSSLTPRPPRKQEGLEFSQITERTEDWQASRWDNVTSLRIDSMPLQVARFRGARDSLDVFIAARTQLASTDDSSGKTARPSAKFWLMDNETLDRVSGTGSVDTAGVLRWTQRAPQGAYYFRAEAMAPRAASAGRASGLVLLATDTSTGFVASGFGISDPLFATRITSTTTPRRWTDVSFDPLLGNIAPGSAISIVWENYEFGERDGAASYAVKLILERKWQAFLNKVRARVISAWAAMLGNEQTPDRVIFRYDRTMAHANAIADQVTLALEDTPAGQYDLTLEITDKVTGNVALRTTRIVIRD